MENPEVIYNQLRDAFIQSRTRQEQMIRNLAENIEKAPEAVRAKLPPIDHEISLKGFIPSLYEETVDRKKYSEELFKCNKFIDAWNELVEKNDAEAAAILADMQKRGI